MVTIHDQQNPVVDGRLERPTQRAPRTRRQWMRPTWERLETPMEVTMYVARR